MASINKVAGEGGCYLQVGAGTYTPTGRFAGMKIYAVGVHATANITNFKYTPTGSNGRPVSQVTVTGDGWQGVSLDATGATAYIPLGVNADSVTVASGSVMIYMK